MFKKKKGIHVQVPYLPPYCVYLATKLW